MSEEMKSNMQEINSEEMEEIAGGAGGHWIVYTVVKGDSLSRIGTRYHVTVDDLVRWNRIANPRLILVGQKLKIYVR